MNKTVIITLIVIGILSAAIPIAVYLVKQQQTTKSSAQVSTASPSPASACTPPDDVQNVTVEYPTCQQGSTLECSFTEADCIWDAVDGASTYKLKVTETDSNTVVKSDVVSSGTTKVVFPVVSGKTYQCDVSATNSCGSTGGIGTDSLLCKVDGVFGSASPAPSPSPVPSPSRVPSPSPSPSPSPLPPSPSPQPVVISCGYTQCAQAGATCAEGLVCVTLAGGNSACALPAYQSLCQQSPTIRNCCQAPPVKVMPNTADLSATQMLAGAGLLLIVLGGGLLLWL